MTSLYKNLPMSAVFLRQKFLLAWACRFFAVAAEAICIVAVSTWAISTQSSSVALGVIFCWTISTQLVTILPCGMLVDRLGSAVSLKLAVTIKALLFLMLAIMGGSPTLTITILVAIRCATSFSDSALNPAWEAILPGLVKKNEIASAQILCSFADQLSRFGGFLFGSFFIASTQLFRVAGITMALSAVVVWFVSAKRDDAVGASNQIGDIPTLFLDGFAVIWKNRWIFNTIILFAFCNIALQGPYQTAMPELLKERGMPKMIGAVYSCQSIGAIVAMFAGKWFAGFQRRGRVAYLAIVAAGVSVFAFGLRMPAFGVWVLVLNILNGAAIGVFGLLWSISLKEQIAGSILGRVASCDYFGSTALAPVGLFAVGKAAREWGPDTLFMIGGLLTMAMAVAAIFYRSVSDWTGTPDDGLRMRQCKACGFTAPETPQFCPSCGAACLQIFDCRHPHRYLWQLFA